MRMMRWFTSALLAGAATAAAQAQPALKMPLPATAPATQPTSAALQALLGRLTSSDDKVRQEAYEQLKRMPLPRSEVVRFVDTTTDPRAKTLAASLLMTQRGGLAGLGVRPTPPAPTTGPSVGTISVKVIDADLSPTRLTMHLHGASPQAVFDELARQAKVSFRPASPDIWAQRQWPAAMLDIDFDNQSWWAAVQEINAATGIQPYQESNGSWILQQNNGRNYDLAGRFTVASGPIILTAQSVSHTGNVSIARPESATSQITLNMGALCDPKLRLTGMEPVQVLEAVDEKGNSLAPSESIQSGQGRTSYGGGFRSSDMIGVAAPLACPPGIGQRIARVKGVARFIVQGQIQSIEAPEILKARNLTASAGGVKVCIVGLERQQNGSQAGPGSPEAYTLKAIIYNEKLSNSEWQSLRQQCYSGYPRLVDAKDQPLGHTGSSSGGGSDWTEVTWQYYRQPSSSNQAQIGEPAKLTWELPAKTRTLEVPFEFTDLPLP